MYLYDVLDVGVCFDGRGLHFIWRKETYNRYLFNYHRNEHVETARTVGTTGGLFSVTRIPKPKFRDTYLPISLPSLLSVSSEVKVKSEHL